MVPKCIRWKAWTGKKHNNLISTSPIKKRHQIILLLSRSFQALCFLRRGPAAFISGNVKWFSYTCRLHGKTLPLQAIACTPTIRHALYQPVLWQQNTNVHGFQWSKTVNEYHRNFPSQKIELVSTMNTVNESNHYSKTEVDGTPRRHMQRCPKVMLYKASQARDSAYVITHDLQVLCCEYKTTT